MAKDVKKPARSRFFYVRSGAITSSQRPQRRLQRPGQRQRRPWRRRQRPWQRRYGGGTFLRGFNRGGSALLGSFGGSSGGFLGCFGGLLSSFLGLFGGGAAPARRPERPVPGRPERSRGSGFLLAASGHGESDEGGDEEGVLHVLFILIDR